MEEPPATESSQEPSSPTGGLVPPDMVDGMLETLARAEAADRGAVQFGRGWTPGQRALFAVGATLALFVALLVVMTVVGIFV